eukprot:TRINITY_DN25006_c0_g2_i1.p4 TRINITY_DN25006_c0_g2~~TRINITY_DN25006_c0_g2_i1.p4  ORF type:complete len:146 (+),score=18.47 TRINITY_DN25006_c0_g2_i1:180-617(+)
MAFVSSLSRFSFSSSSSSSSSTFSSSSDLSQINNNVSEEEFNAKIGSCPSFNDFSMNSFEDLKQEYKVNENRRSSVELMFRSFSSLGPTYDPDDAVAPAPRRSLSSYASVPLPSFSSFYSSSGHENQIDGMDYYDFVDLVRGCPT